MREYLHWTKYASMMLCMWLMGAPLNAAGPTFLLPEKPKPEGNFGLWMASNGKQLLVGSHQLNRQGKNGSATLYELASGKILAQIEPPENAKLENFAQKGAINATHFFISAPMAGPNKTGKVYVYEIGKKDLPRELAGHHPENEFGSSLAVEGNGLLVGAIWGEANAVYLYSVDKLELQHTFKPAIKTEMWFGQSVAISPEYLAIGIPGLDDGIGGASLYSRADGTLLHELKSDKYRKRSGAGSSVVISGERILVSVSHDPGNKSAVLVFDAKSGKELGMFQGAAGFGYTISVFGDAAAIGGKGIVEVVELTKFTTLGRLKGHHRTEEGILVERNGAVLNDHYFGENLGVDGKNLYVGSSADQQGAGMVVVFSDWAPAKLLKARPAPPPVAVKKETKPVPPKRVEPAVPTVTKWTDTTGMFTIEATYESYLGKGVFRLKKKDGSVVDIPIEKLNPAGQAAAKSASAAEREKLGE